MADTVALSYSALTLLRRRLSGERVEVTDETRPYYEELAAAGLMMPLHSFSKGNRGAYRLTEAACDLWASMQLSGLSNPSPSA